MSKKLIINSFLVATLLLSGLDSPVFAAKKGHKHRLDGDKQEQQESPKKQKTNKDKPEETKKTKKKKKPVASADTTADTTTTPDEKAPTTSQEPGKVRKVFEAVVPNGAWVKGSYRWVKAKVTRSAPSAPVEVEVEEVDGGDNLTAAEPTSASVKSPSQPQISLVRRAWSHCPTCVTTAFFAVGSIPGGSVLVPISAIAEFVGPWAAPVQTAVGLTSNPVTFGIGVIVVGGLSAVGIKKAIQFAITKYLNKQGKKVNAPVGGDSPTASEVVTDGDGSSDDEIVLTDESDDDEDLGDEDFDPREIDISEVGNFYVVSIPATTDEEFASRVKAFNEETKKMVKFAPRKGKTFKQLKKDYPELSDEQILAMVGFYQDDYTESDGDAYLTDSEKKQADV